MHISFNIPSPSHIFDISARAWLVAVVLIAAALLASIAVEIYKRHYSRKKQAELAKHWTALLLTIVSGAFTGLGYGLFLIQHDPIISTIPFVERHVTGVVGVAYLLYNVRLNNPYQSVAKVLGKWSGATASPTGTPVPQVVSPPASPDTFA